MQTFFASLRKSVSNPRIDAYIHRGVNPDNIELFSHYLWNIALCESLYPSLQTFEVMLRNSIHEAATNAFGTPRWYESGRGILKRDEIMRVDKAK